MLNQVRILYIDDSPFDRELVLDALEKEHNGFLVTQTATQAEFMAALAHGEYDLVLSDFNILGFEGLQVIDAVHARDPDLPVVIVTGTGSEEIAVEAMKRGAADYVIKTPQHIQRLPFTIHTALERKRLRESNRQADLALRASEERFRTLVNSMNDIVYTLDSRQRHIGVFGAWVERSGYTPELFLGKTAREIFGDQTDPVHETANQQALEGENVVYEWAAARAAGMRYYQTALSPLRDSHGAIIGIVGVGRDITERKQAEERIRRQVGYLTALHEIDQVITSNLDLQRSLETLLARAVALLQADAAMVLLVNPHRNTLEYAAGAGFRTATAQTSCVELGEGYAGRAALERHIVQVPNLLEATDNVLLTEGLRGEEFVSYYGAPMMVKGDVIGVLEIFHRSVVKRDEEWFNFFKLLAGQAAIVIMNARLYSQVNAELHERQRAEAEVRRLNAELERRVAERTIALERALRVKDEFLANMSHELRTPLNAILGLSESLEDGVAGPLNAKQQRYAHIIYESGYHLLSLINDVLDLAKIEANQMTLDISMTDLPTICQESLRMIAELAQKKRQWVSYEDDGELPQIWADQLRLKQMLVNLLSNAVKFTPEDGRIGLVVCADRPEGCILITVWDEGIGISAEDQERLFQPFVQVDSSLARRNAGTGLGLALVSQMARLHGGRVQVQSEPGKGSRFTIVLPWHAEDADTLLANR